MFVPARRQFSVQTGVVWRGVRGILLDTETAECHRRTDILGEKKRTKENETFLNNAPFCQKKKATHFWSVKNHKLSRRERSRVMGVCDKAVRSGRLFPMTG